MKIPQDLPEKYKNTVMNLCGKQGQVWLENLDNVIRTKCKKYHLSKLSPIENLNYNFVATAQSEKYGEVIVKIGLPDGETVQEITALNSYHGNLACKCYEADFDELFFVLEKLKPGTSLLNVKNRDKRIGIFCALAEKLPVKADRAVPLPTFRETMDAAFGKARREKSGYEKILDFIEIADRQYKEIQLLNLEQFVLHGDLHHGNILLDGNTYKAIDPHGRIGEKMLEAGAFIMNELWLYGSKKEEIKKVICKAANGMKIDEKIMAKVTFTRMVLSAAWSAEEGDRRMVDKNYEICREIMEIF